MRDQIFPSVIARLVSVPLIVSGLLVSAAGQTPARSIKPGQSTVKAPVKKKWRTPWTDPDLQGSWSNTNTTPLERPDKWAGREFITEQERAEREKERVRQEEGAYYDTSWTDSRTSLIYDPPNGKMPPFTPEGEARLKKIRERAANDDGPFDGPEDLDLRVRCIIRDPLPRIPANYGNSYEIVQTPGFVAIFHEAIHETRIIPLDKRPHLNPSVRQWFGDPRGHWEGETLVVETTNFNNQTSFQGSTQNLQLVERWTRAADDRIEYTFTVMDPETWTRPWSASLPWHASGPLYEYACHEDNVDLYGILTGARANDKKTAEAGQKRSGK